MPEPIVVGLFVGGASTRMGRAKGLLPEPGGPRSLLDRLAEEARTALGQEVPLVLVGRRDEYRGVPLPTLDDARSDSGPLGGLVALLDYARTVGSDDVVCLACDLPFIDAPLIGRLARERTGAAALAPRPGGLWQPLCARYRVEAAHPVARRALDQGRLALRKILDEVGAAELSVDRDEEQKLRDWDRPEDVGPR